MTSGQWKQLCTLRAPNEDGGNKGQARSDLTNRVDTRQVPLHNAGADGSGTLRSSVLYANFARGLARNYVDQPNIEHDPADNSMNGIIPSPVPCVDQEGFNLWVLQAIEILSSYHRVEYTIDGLDADQDNLPQEEEIIDGNAEAGGDSDGSIIDGGLSYS